MSDKWITSFMVELPDAKTGDWDADFVDFEISVVRSSNKHGLKSYGWGDEDKIIVFSSNNVHVADAEGEAIKQIDWMKNVANIIKDALNANGI